MRQAQRLTTLLNGEVGILDGVVKLLFRQSMSLPTSVCQRPTVVEEQKRLLFAFGVVYMQGLNLTVTGFRRSGAGSKGLQPADAINLFAASGTGRCMTSSSGVRPDVIPGNSTRSSDLESSHIPVVATSLSP